MFKYVVLPSLLVVCSAVGPEDGCCISPEKIKTGVSFDISYSLASDQMFERIPKEKLVGCEHEWVGYQVLDGHGKGNRHSEVRCQPESSETIYKSIAVQGDGSYFAIDYRNGTETCERVYNEKDVGGGDQWYGMQGDSCFGHGHNSWYHYKRDVMFGTVKAARYTMSGMPIAYADIDVENGCVPITLNSPYTANWHVSNFKFGAPSAHAFDIPESCKKAKMMLV
jgi:hypothetical protein